MGTTWPSGSVAVAGCAVKLTDWAKDAPAVRRRAATASTDVFRTDLRFVDRMGLLLRINALIRFVDNKGLGVNEHHHHHAARENVVGGDLTFVVGVPHEGKASFRCGGVGNRPGGWG